MQKGQKHTYPFRSVNNQLFSSSNKITCEYLHTCGVCTCKWVRLGASVLTIRHPTLGHPYMQNLMGTLCTRARRATLFLLQTPYAKGRHLAWRCSQTRHHSRCLLAGSSIVALSGSMDSPSCSVQMDWIQTISCTVSQLAAR